MGCSESKDSVTRISVESARDKLQESVKNLEKNRGSSSSSTSSGMGSSASTSSEERPVNSASSATKDIAQPKDEECDDEAEDQMAELPSTLEQIPESDLGESLDARRMRSLWNRPASNGNANASTLNLFSSTASRRGDVIQCMSAAQPSSAKSDKSSDSGIYDLEDDYAFVITESSSPEKIKMVETEFTPVENLDLTITGKACPRMLSGSQRARVQEHEILESLREDGFISTSKQKAGGGLAFEIVESTPEALSAGGKIKPKDFLPKGHKLHLESQRNKHHLQNLTSADMERRQFLAEERRRLDIEAKLEKLASQNTNNAIEHKIEEMKKMKDDKAESALSKREAHLRELRDKLKAQNKKVQQVKLKKLINGPPVPIPMAPGFRSRSIDTDDDDFFKN